MSSFEHEKRLFVEGEEDKYTIISLLQKHIEWPETKQKPELPVDVQHCGGKSGVLSRLSMTLKGRGWETLGIVIDADLDDERCSAWKELRLIGYEAFPTMEEILPTSGGVWQSRDGRRLGVWMMPDNVAPGMLETFLRSLVPAAEEPLWLHAQEAVRSAVQRGAQCHERHRDKSDIYTWLAWQDPPGQSFGRALTQRLLDPHAEFAIRFVSWFIELFQLHDRRLYATQDTPDTCFLAALE